MALLAEIDDVIDLLENMEVSDEAPESKAPALKVNFQTKFSLSVVSVDTLLSSPEDFIGQTITMGGWVQTVRSSRFIQLNDGSCVLDAQLVVDLDDADMQKIMVDVTRGSSIRVVGLIVESQGRGQVVDVQVQELVLTGGCDPKTYPLPKTKKGGLKMETLRNFQHLRVRTKVMQSSQRVRNEACKATHDFFYERGFQYVHTPLITAADCEGAGETFTVTNLLAEKGHPVGIDKVPTLEDGSIDYSKDFFGKMASLTVSGQLHVETFCHGIGSVYTFGPTFRAEESHTNRHLAEFWMIEPEVAFCSFEDVQDLAEDYLKYCLARILENCATEIELLNKRFGKKGHDQIQYLTNIVESDFARVTYTEGVEILVQKVESGEIMIVMGNHQWENTVEEISSAKHIDGEPIMEQLNRWKAERKLVTVDDARKVQIENWQVIGNKKMRKKFKGKLVFENPVYWGVDLSSEHEKYLTQHITKRPTILTDYPLAIKSFYMKANEDGKTCQACDVLCPGVGEVIGGSQREDVLERLLKRVEEIGLSEDDMDWYLDLRKYGSIPHGGFGLGLERLLMLATGIENIRDLIPYPRYPGVCRY